MNDDVKYPEPEKSTLLYLESCVVDKNAKLEQEKMNDGDWANIDKFEEEGLLKVERLTPKEVKESRSRSWKPSHKVTEFTDEAWEKAHNYRKARSPLQD